MIPNKKPRQVQSHGTGIGGEFGISRGDEAHIMTILRDTLYSDKILAVIREYSTNAWDAHRDVGKQDVPIKVTLPTADEPTLSIRDFGKGLSHDDVLQIYTQYGASTKRSDDNTVGMLGIGCKSGFAYADSFTVVSYHEGKKSIYVAVLDKTEKGKMDLLHEQDCPLEETGVEIQIAVKPTDIAEFIAKAQTFFMYFQPRPIINAKIDALPSVQKTLKNGVIYDQVRYSDSRWMAIMGCVPYHINLNQLPDSSKGVDGLPDFIRSISGVLYFGIGDVQINASREELKYSDLTKKALVERFTALVDEYVAETLKGINDGKFSAWERHLKGRVLADLKLPVPAECKDLTATNIPFPWRTKEDDEDDITEKAPKTLEILHDQAGKKHASSLKVSKHVRFIIKDDLRALQGYQLRYEDYLVRRKGKPSWDAVVEELNEIIAKMGILGIPVLKTSEMTWAEFRYRGAGKIINPKHRKKLFRLTGTRHRKPYSDNWISETREPKPEDLYVIIYEFQAEGIDIFNAYSTDSDLANALGVPMPPVYGYKSTGAEPVDPLTIIGQHYPEWRKGFAKSISELPEVRATMEAWGWIKLTADYGSMLAQDSYFRSKGLGYRKIRKELGDNHPISKIIKSHFRARTVLKHKKSTFIEAIGHLVDRLGDDMFELEADLAMKKVIETYPLLALKEFALQVFWHDQDAPMWLQYVKTLDELTALKERHGTSPSSSPATDSPVEGESKDGSAQLHADQRHDHPGLGGSGPDDPEGDPSVHRIEGSHPGGEVGGHPQLPDGGEEPSDLGARAVHP